MTGQFETGQHFGAYVLGQPIGRGGMGVVYQATHVHLGRTVALKLLAPELSSSADFRARFLRESRLAAALEHPSIVPVYDAGDVNGVLYIAMRFVRGTDLAAALARGGPLEPGVAAGVIGQVAGALDAAHAAGLVHRDVKPANVMLEGERCYLTDFGLTKRADETAALTMTGQFLGTVDYIAPEQIEGRDVDGRADQYALGCVLFECLTGSRPYPRDSDVATLYAQLHDPPPRPGALRPGLPVAFDGVIAEAMAKAPDARFRSCGAMAEAARAAAQGAGAQGAGGQGAGPTAARATAARAVPAPAPPTAARATAARAVPPSAPPTASPPPELPTAPLPTGAATAQLPTRSPRRRRAAPLAIAALLVVAAVVAVVALSGGGGNGGNGRNGGGTSGASPPSASQPRVAGTPLPVGRRPVGVVFAAGYLWVADSAGASVTRVKPDGSGRATLRVGAEPWGLAANSSAVWAASGAGGKVTRIDTRTLAPQRFDTGGHPLFLTADDRTVQVTNATAGTVSTLDARTGAPIGRPVRVGQEPLAIVTAGSSSWVANRDSGTVSRVSGGRVVQNVHVGGAPVGLLYRAGVLWVTDVADDSVIRLDTASGRTTSTNVGRKPYALGFFDGAVWVTNREDGNVMRLDPGTGRQRGSPIDVPGDPIAMTADGGGDVWVTSHAAGTMTRITP